MNHECEQFEEEPAAPVAGRFDLPNGAGSNRVGPVATRFGAEQREPGKAT